MRSTILSVLVTTVLPLAASAQAHADSAPAAGAAKACEEAAERQGLRVRRAMQLDLKAPADRVFPLFGPVEETRWDPTWLPDMVYPADGTQIPGAVFAVRHPGQADSVWVMTAYDPRARRLQYVRVTPGSIAVQLDIAVTPRGAEASRARVVYSYTALSEQGRQAVCAFRTTFSQRKPEWEAAINHYLETGAALRPID